MAKQGDVVSRTIPRNDCRDTIRLVGVANGAWVAECSDDFGPPFPVSVNELAEDYGVSDPATPEALSTADLIRADQAANEAAAVELARAYGGSGQSLFPLDLGALAQRMSRPKPPAGSPEAVFADMEPPTQDGEVKETRTSSRRRT
jgi:hypothetical protein